MRSWTVLVFVLALAGARGVDAIVLDTGRNGAAVARLTGDSLSSVGQLGGCTATPVSRTLLVSAAHCFVDSTGRFQDPAGSYFFIEYVDAPDVWAQVQTARVHPAYPRCAAYACGTGGRNRCMASSCFANDIAVVALVAPLPAHVRIYRLAHFANPPIGATVTHVGFGRTGTGVTGDVTSSSGAQWGLNRITGRSSQNGAMQTRFDASGLSYLGCPPKGCLWTPLQWLNVFEVTTAPGDSGGPMFFNPVVDLDAALTRCESQPSCFIFPKLVPDEEMLLGVTSHGVPGAKYGTTSGYIFAPAYAPWIQSWDSTVEVASASTAEDPLPNAPVNLLEASATPDPPAGCQDGIDNDGDGFTDVDDPGCLGATDPAERSTDLPCDDGSDNDGDGLGDMADPGCFAPEAPQESWLCDDKADNDGDGLIDLEDPNCVAPWIDSEVGGCGLGAELALLLPLLARVRTRRAVTSAAGSRPGAHPPEGV